MANIETELKRMREGKQLNAINLYLLGVILKQKGNSEEARDNSKLKIRLISTARSTLTSKTMCTS
jgi:hypothetical protein